MVQPEDNKTLSLLPPVTEKRGRGRPRKEGALTNAQRQAAFKLRRKEAGFPVTVTKMLKAPSDAYDDLVVECERLREEAAELRVRLIEANRALKEPVGRKWSYAQITRGAERVIRGCLDRAAKSDTDEGRRLNRTWAYGVYMGWYDLTVGWMDDGDVQRLQGLGADVLA